MLFAKEPLASCTAGSLLLSITEYTSVAVCVIGLFIALGMRCEGILGGGGLTGLGAIMLRLGVPAGLGERVGVEDRIRAGVRAL